jgi:demethylmenaquinone methyltransferase/2-methoxy-6-polyprenyl-1,4-benzoquinol methylase
MEFLMKMEAGKDTVLMDLMCGMGETWGQSRSRFNPGRFYALDFSLGMLAKAKRRLAKWDDIEVIQEDILQNSLPDAHFDVISCAFGLKTFNSEQLKILAAEIRRILKPGGQFSFIEVSVPPNRLLRSLYLLYLKRFIPILGWLFLGNPAEYKMLGVYTEAFGNSREAYAIFRDAGLEVEYAEYFYGCATGIFGKRKV